jgi:ribosomal 50S subunit-associated protein YjgA (DUF615 family)
MLQRVVDVAGWLARELDVDDGADDLDDLAGRHVLTVALIHALDRIRRRLRRRRFPISSLVIAAWRALL